MKCLLIAALITTSIPVIPAFAGSLPIKGYFQGNQSVIVQSGVGNSSSVTVSGSNNMTSIAQSGVGNTFSQNVTGSNQSLSVIQLNSRGYEGTKESVHSTPNGGSSTYIIQVTPHNPD